MNMVDLYTAHGQTHTVWSDGTVHGQSKLFLRSNCVMNLSRLAGFSKSTTGWGWSSVWGGEAGTLADLANHTLTRCSGTFRHTADDRKFSGTLQTKVHSPFLS